MLLTRVVLLFQSIASCHFATWNLAVVILFFDSTTSWNTPPLSLSVGKFVWLILSLARAGFGSRFRTCFDGIDIFFYWWVLCLQPDNKYIIHKLHTDGLTKQQPYKFYWQPPTKILFTAVQRLMHVPVFSWHGSHILPVVNEWRNIDIWEHYHIGMHARMIDKKALVTVIDVV